MAGIKDAIVELLREDADVRTWATGGIFVRRAPKNLTADTRSKYLVIKLPDAYLEETDTQLDPVELTTDRIRVCVWAKNSKDADNGANLVRKALDAVQNVTAASIVIQRIRWDGATDHEVEDASGAEQLLDECRVEFVVGYVLP